MLKIIWAACFAIAAILSWRQPLTFLESGPAKCLAAAKQRPQLSHLRSMATNSLER